MLIGSFGPVSAEVQGQLSLGKQVIITAHSAGNEYANDVWGRLMSDEQMDTHIVAVATLIDVIADGSNRYTVLEEDDVLDITPNAPDPNASMAGIPCADIFAGIPVPWLCHGFKEAYMLGADPEIGPRTRIVNDIVALLPQVQATINFETPPLGSVDRRGINPYVDGATGVVFTGEARGEFEAVVGLVKNSATSACVPPADANQKLGTAVVSEVGIIGRSGFAIKATFPNVLLPTTAVSVEFQTGAGTPVRLRLFDPSGTEVASVTAVASPDAGICPNNTGESRARTTVTATSTTQQVAFAIMDLAEFTGGRVFVIDNFSF